MGADCFHKLSRYPRFPHPKRRGRGVALPGDAGAFQTPISEWINAYRAQCDENASGGARLVKRRAQASAPHRPFCCFPRRPSLFRAQGEDPRDPTTLGGTALVEAEDEPPAPLRVGIPAEYGVDELSPGSGKVRSAPGDQSRSLLVQAPPGALRLRDVAPYPARQLAFASEFRRFIAQHHTRRRGRRLLLLSARAVVRLKPCPCLRRGQPSQLTTSLHPRRLLGALLEQMTSAAMRSCVCEALLALRCYSSTPAPVL